MKDFNFSNFISVPLCLCGKRLYCPTIFNNNSCAFS